MPMFLLKGFTTTEKRKSLFSKPEIVREPWETLYQATDEAEIRRKLHEFKWTVESIEPYTKEDEERAWQELRRRIESGEAHVHEAGDFRRWSRRLTLPLALSGIIGLVVTGSGLQGAPAFGIKSSWLLTASGVLILFCAKRLFEVRGELEMWCHR